MLLLLSFRFRSHRNDRKPKGNQIPKIIDSPRWVLDHTSKPWNRRVLLNSVVPLSYSWLWVFWIAN